MATQVHLLYAAGQLTTRRLTSREIACVTQARYNGRICIYSEAESGACLVNEDIGKPLFQSGPPRAAKPHTVGDPALRATWDWVWKDTLGRLVPFGLASVAYARFAKVGAAGIGLSAERWRQDVPVGVATAVPLAVVATIYRAAVAPHHRLPGVADQALQSFFYLAMNAPIEEMFWRGTVQSLSIRGASHVPGLKQHPVLAGWAATTTIFGLYHRLGRWSWKSIAGVTAAGGLYGALYVHSGEKRRSIIVPAIVHGFMTAGS